MDSFDQFLRKVDPFVGSLYRSLEFACVAARNGVEWVLISGKAILSPEPFNPGSKIAESVVLPDLVALSGRIRANSVNNLVANLRNSWVIDTLASERIQLVKKGSGNYSWPPMPGIFATEGKRWKTAFWVEGTGPHVGALVRSTVDGELRHRTSYNGFDGLCRNLGLPARRNNLMSSFRISAELPARFEAVQTDLVKRTLEIDSECIGTPELRIDWRPESHLQLIPHPWHRSRPGSGMYHASVPLREGEETAELMLGFGEIEPVDTWTHDVFGERGGLTSGVKMGSPGGTRLPKSQEARFETAFHLYWSDGQQGQGGAGTVFKVHDEDGRVFAIKQLDPSKATVEKVKRFENELRFCERQSHRNIINVIDKGFVLVGGKNVPFYVMPFYPKTFRQLMIEGIPNQKILPYFAKILDGVEAAHLLGVWHRDLKPENILCNPETDALVVADFGIARFKEEDLYTAVETKDDARLANFQYAAPEQRVRGRGVDRRADIYALGLILNEMFTGDVPQGEGYAVVAAVAPECKYLDALVARMIQQAPDARPPDVQQVKKKLIGNKNAFIALQELDAKGGKLFRPVTQARLAPSGWSVPIGRMEI